MERIDTPVLVVGAGPVGLMASLLLAQQGIRHRVIDRRSGPHRAPQAHVVNPRTLEICRAAGIDWDALRALATPRADGSHVVFMTTLPGEELGRLPYERQGDDTLRDTPTPLLNLSQHRFEPALLDRVRSEVHYSHEWEALEQDAGAVTARVHELPAGRRHEVQSR
jgi:2-polyprenyl-6-methoxyphenol hydroxylase-like FAD-dependent oxidoreductase